MGICKYNVCGGKGNFLQCFVYGMQFMYLYLPFQTLLFLYVRCTERFPVYSIVCVFKIRSQTIRFTGSIVQAFYFCLWQRRVITSKVKGLIRTCICFSTSDKNIGIQSVIRMHSQRTFAKLIFLSLLFSHIPPVMK